MKESKETTFSRIPQKNLTNSWIDPFLKNKKRSAIQILELEIFILSLSIFFWSYRQNKGPQEKTDGRMARQKRRKI